MVLFVCLVTRVWILWLNGRRIYLIKVKAAPTLYITLRESACLLWWWVIEYVHLNRVMLLALPTFQSPILSSHLNNNNSTWELNRFNYTCPFPFIHSALVSFYLYSLTMLEKLRKIQINPWSWVYALWRVNVCKQKTTEIYIGILMFYWL